MRKRRPQQTKRNLCKTFCREHTMSNLWIQTIKPKFCTSWIIWITKLHTIKIIITCTESTNKITALQPRINKWNHSITTVHLKNNIKTHMFNNNLIAYMKAQHIPTQTTIRTNEQQTYMYIYAYIYICVCCKYNGIVSKADVNFIPAPRRPRTSKRTARKRNASTNTT